MKISSHCWFRTALQPLQCIFIVLKKYSNKHPAYSGAALIRVNMVFNIILDNVLTTIFAVIIETKTCCIDSTG